MPFLLYFLFAWGIPRSLAATDIPFLHTSIDEGLALASAKNKRVFVHFTASWCLPCQWMEENTFQDTELSSYLRENFIALQLDVDSYTGFREKEAYTVTSLPTLLVLDASGGVLLRLERTVEAAELRQLLHQLPNTTTSHGRTLSSLTPTPGTTHLSKSQLLPVAAGHSEPSPSPHQPKHTYGVEVALFSHYEGAIPYVSRLERELTDPVTIIVNDRDYDRTVYRIVVGRFSSAREASQLQARLSSVGLNGEIKDLSEL